MTKDDFIKLQEEYRLSNVGLMAFLREVGMSFSQYNYWLCKFYGDDGIVWLSIGVGDSGSYFYTLYYCKG